MHPQLEVLLYYFYRLNYFSWIGYDYLNYCKSLCWFAHLYPQEPEEWSEYSVLCPVKLLQALNQNIDSSSRNMLEIVTCLESWLLTHLFSMLCLSVLCESADFPALFFPSALLSDLHRWWMRCCFYLPYVTYSCPVPGWCLPLSSMRVCWVELRMSTPSTSSAKRSGQLSVTWFAFLSPCVITSSWIGSSRTKSYTIVL